MRTQCFFRLDGKIVKNGWISECESATLEDRDGYPVQVGGPPDQSGNGCMPTWGFAFPYEVGFALNFTVDANKIPTGCGEIEQGLL